MPGCAVRSNGGISLQGSASLTASSVYAGGLITGAGAGPTWHQNAGTIADPYASYPPIQTAFTALGGLPDAVVNSNDLPSAAPGTSRRTPVRQYLALPTSEAFAAFCTAVPGRLKPADRAICGSPASSATAVTR
jgi:hypothetical protein